MHANRLELAISFLRQQNMQLTGNTFAEQCYIMHILKTKANHFLFCNKHNVHRHTDTNLTSNTNTSYQTAESSDWASNWNIDLELHGHQLELELPNLVYLVN